MSARKPESEKKYQEEKSKQPAGFCFICEKELLKEEFNYWVILKNRFPYDNLTEIHDLLCVKRHISSEEELTFEETKELYEIKKGLKKYSSVIFNLPQNQSLKGHLHFHLIKID